MPKDLGQFSIEGKLALGERLIIDIRYEDIYMEELEPEDPEEEELEPEEPQAKPNPQSQNTKYVRFDSNAAAAKRK